MKDLIKKTLAEGFANGSFTKEQVTIYALNYQLKGVLDETDVTEILAIFEPVEVPNAD